MKELLKLASMQFVGQYLQYVYLDLLQIKSKNSQQAVLVEFW